MAICVTAWLDSQSESSRNSPVVVPKMRFSFRIAPSSAQIDTQTATEHLWTSIPQHRRYTTSIETSPVAAGTPVKLESPSRALVTEASLCCSRRRPDQTLQRARKLHVITRSSPVQPV